MKILVIGTYVVDIVNKNYERNVFRPDNISFCQYSCLTSGGNANNVAMNLSSLGNFVAACGMVGEDFSGDYILKCLKSNKINIECMTKNRNNSTGISVIFVEQTGEKSIMQFIGANSELTKEQLKYIDWGNYNIVVISGIGLLNGLEIEISNIINKVHMANGKIVVDTSASVKELSYKFDRGDFTGVDYFVPNLREALEISNCKNEIDAARYFINHGCKNILIKMGENGCYIKNNECEKYVSGNNVKVVDTTGAGDAFVAGLVHALIRNNDLIQAAEFANSIGAKCVTKLGANAILEQTKNVY